MFDLYQEFRQLISRLDDGDIDYALCGGLAMAVYDHARATVDIVLLILLETYDSVAAIAKELGYTIRGLEMSFARALSKSDGYLKSIRQRDMYCRWICSWSRPPFALYGIPGKRLSGRGGGCQWYRAEG